MDGAVGHSALRGATKYDGAKENGVRAKRLRTETTMTLKWIANRLNMRTWTLAGVGPKY